MEISLIKLSNEKKHEIYDMLQEIPSDENGFINSMNGKSLKMFDHWLDVSISKSLGRGLEDWEVPQSIYLLLVDGYPVGMGKIRHELTEFLQKQGGNCAYAIRPSERSKGYGKILLKFLIKETKKLNINKVLLTIRRDNNYSLNVALSNGGVIENQTSNKVYVWIFNKNDEL